MRLEPILRIGFILFSFFWTTDYVSAVDYELRLTESKDGLTFSESSRRLVVGGSAPDLELLPNGDLALFFDSAEKNKSNSNTRLHIAISHDKGRSWTKARPVIIRDKNGRLIRGCHGDLVCMADGKMRLYFTTVESLENKSNTSGVVKTARARSLARFEVDGDIEKRARENGVSRASVFTDKNKVHLYLSDSEPVSSGQGNEKQLYSHQVSRDGRRFFGKSMSNLFCFGQVGSFLNLKHEVRAYVATAEGVSVLRSKKTDVWEQHATLCQRGCWDPAVARVADDSFIMAYCTKLQKRSSPGILQVAEESEYANALKTGEQKTRQEGENSGEGNPSSPFAKYKDDPWVNEDGFAPRPNFNSRVDYFKWWQEQLCGNPVDNAYPYYAKFMPGIPGIDPEVPAWPEVNNMFTNYETRFPPGPWNPVDKPEWEISSQAVQGLLEQFREATLHKGYSQEVNEKHQALMDDGSGHPLLLNMRLPLLSSHRSLVKATLADAWRTDDGAVSSERMLDAWKTTYRAAEHMNQGSTLVEELVSTAERNLIQKNARWALKHGVFKGKELETAFDTLRNSDSGNPDPIKAVCGEHALAMDVVQSLFWPDENTGKITVDKEKLRECGLLGDEEISGLPKIEKQDVLEAIELFDSYYPALEQAMSIGYPDVRREDIDAISEEYVTKNPIAQAFLPGLSRVHTLRTRVETSRRATQLSYAAHIYKNRIGSWPASVEELSAELEPDMGIDPFTGEYFGYELTDAGPRIYSLGENARDDGGIHSPRWGDRSNEGESDDYVFWPPQE